MGNKTSKLGPSRLPMPPGFDPTLREGNPHYGHRMQLYCSTGYHIAILPNGKVVGIDEDMDKYAIMEFTSAGWSEVRIRGVESNLYLAISKKGHLYGEGNPRTEGTVFIEALQGYYNTYLSRPFSHKGWYVGLKRNGKAKPGPQTKYGQKSIQFLPRRLTD